MTAPVPAAATTPITIPEPLRLLLNEFEARAPTDIAKVDDELVHSLCGEVLCDVQDGDSLSVLVGMAVEHRCPEAITLTLLNRPEVIAFIDGPEHHARVPDDPGSDVVYVELPDRRHVVISGETVIRADEEFRVGRNGRIRVTFPRVK